MSHKDRVLSLLNDQSWHSFNELREVYYKYTQRIKDLRYKGYVIETRPNGFNKHGDDYRLVYSPVKNTVSSPKSQLAHASAAPELFRGSEVNGRTYF